jgi:hypothetical protein
MELTQLDWWGFRLRIPGDYVPKPVSAAESLAFGFGVSASLELLWLSWLCYESWRNPQQPWDWVYHLAIPLLLCLPTLLSFLFVRGAGADVLRISPWLIMSREKGAMASWDTALSGVGLVVALACVFRLGRSFGVTCLLLTLHIVLFHALLGRFQECIDFTKRRWGFSLPGWLTGLSENPEEIVAPDSDADPVYQFLAPDGTAYKVGVRITPEVLAALRKINADAEGTLFEKSPQAVALEDRPPAAKVGQDELLRMCRQIVSICRKHKLTPLQTANAVLGFVQLAIKYAFDEDSTKDFAGGPFKEYGRFPVETIHDSVGDCECTGILCASLLAYLGFKSALLFVSIKDSTTGEVTYHVATGLDAEGALLAEPGVADAFDYIGATDGSGRRYLYGETAIDDSTMAFGSIPPEWKDSLTVRRVEPIEAQVTMGR